LVELRGMSNELNPGMIDTAFALERDRAAVAMSAESIYHLSSCVLRSHDARRTRGATTMARRQSIDLSYMRHGNPFPMGCKIGNVVASGAIHCNDERSGQIPETPEEQVGAMFNNIRNFMTAAGGTPDDILKIRLLVKEPQYSAYINKEWVKMFPDEESRPTRKIDFPNQLHGGFFAAEIYAVLDQ
jgi:enamine deaminase RidA (YjgF/YER057c/UK114 family)